MICHKIANNRFQSMKITLWKCWNTAPWIKSLHKSYWFQQSQNFTCCVSYPGACHAWLWDLKHHCLFEHWFWWWRDQADGSLLLILCVCSSTSSSYTKVCDRISFLFSDKSRSRVGASLLLSTVHSDGRKSLSISLIPCYSHFYLLLSFFAKNEVLNF